MDRSRSTVTPPLFDVSDSAEGAPNDPLCCNETHTQKKKVEKTAMKKKKCRHVAFTSQDVYTPKNTPKKV
jgi:hypothetical protein